MKAAYFMKMSEQLWDEDFRHYIHRRVAPFAADYF
jgi:hypothetical protein